ncbi:hypothetical protein TREES_T100021883 [Tupaia chinensis]|uniref:Uncharacterized protein n=1 Tax=Tupaia chinensis TaxID=246437 RepID=L9JF71_TUPCH|nr:hypothetical protein TREES_T100021883 [Tupaia chinensis]
MGRGGASVISFAVGTPICPGASINGVLEEACSFEGLAVGSSEPFCPDKCSFEGLAVGSSEPFCPDKAPKMGPSTCQPLVLCRVWSALCRPSSAAEADSTSSQRPRSEHYGPQNTVEAEGFPQALKKL